MATLSLIGSVTAGYKIWAAVVFALFVVLGKTSWELDHGSASGRIKIPVQHRGRIQFGGRWMQTGGRESPFAPPGPASCSLSHALPKICPGTALPPENQDSCQ